jgi:hypothetical protein
VGVWDLERGAAPADQEARQIEVMLVQSGPRYVSADIGPRVGADRVIAERERFTMIAFWARCPTVATR